MVNFVIMPVFRQSIIIKLLYQDFAINFLMNSIVTEQEGKGFYLAQVKNSDLAAFSYYVQSGKEAYLVDPIFDVKIYEDILTKRGATLKYLLMTHYHADFISGHLEFKVPIFMGPGSINKMNHYQIKELKEGDTVPLSGVKTEVMHTPGHTPEGVCYILKDGDGKNACIFTGDTVFLGDVGRPDLSTEEGLTKIDLAGMLFDSLSKIKKMDDELRIYPAHGSGSACGGKKIAEGNYSTVGEQKQKNHAVKIEGKNEFISTILDDIQKPPSYYFHDSKVNKIGPSQHQVEFKKANNALGVKQFKELAKVCKIFDTRSSVADGVIKNSYWTHNKAPITSWIPMVAGPKDEILIVVEEGKGQETLQRFIRLGYFSVKGYNNFKIAEYDGEKEGLQVVGAKQALQLKERTHLDVRNKDEWKKTGVLEGAITIPLKQLKDRCHEVKGLSNIVINCKTGMRARFAMSLLATSGIKSVAMAEKVEQLGKLGFHLVPYVQTKEEE